MVGLLARRRRRAPLHDDHRERPRHAAREHHPDRPRRPLGLAQLYQLRGRVGRSREARLCVPARARRGGADRGGAPAPRGAAGPAPSSAAASGSRTSTSRSAARGISWARSSRASSAAVGYETYMELLEEAIAELRGRAAFEVDRPGDPAARRGAAPRGLRARGEPAPRPLQAPAGAADEEELERIRDELLDRYGPLPAEAESLLEVIRLKLLAGARGRRRRVRGRRRSCSGRPPARAVDPARLVELLNDRAPACSSATTSASTRPRRTGRRPRSSRGRAGARGACWGGRSPALPASVAPVATDAALDARARERTSTG